MTTNGYTPEKSAGRFSCIWVTVFRKREGEVAGEVVEIGVAVFRDSRNSIWMRSAAVLPGLRKESI